MTLRLFGLMLALMLPAAATAADAQMASPVKLDNNKPIEVSADTLEVQQDKHLAIFTGNVIATQGVDKMRADKMTVYYRQAAQGAKGAKPAAAASDGMSGNNIYRIESDGNVVLTSPSEVAVGDHSVYDVDADTFDIVGNVTLTRDKNILKGTKLHYNLATGRSVLSAEGASSGGRVHGLFVPGDDTKPAGAAPATTTVQPTGTPAAK